MMLEVNKNKSETWVELIEWKRVKKWTLLLKEPDIVMNKENKFRLP